MYIYRHTELRKALAENGLTRWVETGVDCSDNQLLQGVDLNHTRDGIREPESKGHDSFL